MNDYHRKLLHEYLEEEKAKGRRVQGIIGSRNRVPKLFAYLEEMGLMLSEVRLKEAAGYQGWLIETGGKKGKYEKATIVGYIKGASGFYEYLKKKGMVAANPFTAIKRVRVDKKLPRQP